MKVTEVDGIAYTRGPGNATYRLPILLVGILIPWTGMTGCLGIGAASAKALSSALNKPLVGVHHMVRPDFITRVTVLD